MQLHYKEKLPTKNRKCPLSTGSSRLAQEVPTKNRKCPLSTGKMSVQSYLYQLTFTLTKTGYVNVQCSQPRITDWQAEVETNRHI